MLNIITIRIIIVIITGAFRRWNSEGCRIVRCQDLGAEDFIDDGAAGCNERLIVSHAWLAAGHPDPEGLQLADLIAEFERLNVPDGALVFYDFASLPQRPRTQNEEERFQAALAQMHLLYTKGAGAVLIIPGVPSNARNHTKYCKRGWCYFEFSISALYGRIVNFDEPAVRQLLEDEGAPVSLEIFRERFGSKKFTSRGDEQVVLRLYGVVHAEREAGIKRATCDLAVALTFFVCSFIVGIACMIANLYWQQDGIYGGFFGFSAAMGFYGLTFRTFFAGLSRDAVGRPIWLQWWPCLRRQGVDATPTYMDDWGPSLWALTMYGAFQVVVFATVMVARKWGLFAALAVQIIGLVGIVGAPFVLRLAQRCCTRASRISPEEALVTADDVPHVSLLSGWSGD